jgi:hypothetical protein
MKEDLYALLDAGPTSELGTPEEIAVLERALELRVLICGSRTWTDGRVIGRVLSGLLDEAMTNFQKLVVIEGCASGADSFACHFFDGPCQAPGGGSHAGHTHVEHRHFPAHWRHGPTCSPGCTEVVGKAAGHIRNQRMQDEGQPDLAFAFSEQPVTSGTGGMINILKRAGVPVYVVSHG